MRFISPKTDFAFKKIFGSTDSKDILMSFLNGLLYDGESTIQDLEIIDPYSSGNTIGLKDSYLDVKATLDTKEIVIIEMQVLNVAAFNKRVIYNGAKTYVTQLKSGEGYFKLNPVIALTITDFIMFDRHDRPLSRYRFKDIEDLVDYSDDEIDLVFVELPKFKKTLEELETLGEKWMYFIKNVPDLEVIPEQMQEIPALNKAMNIANRANLSIEELEDLEKREMFFFDQIGAVRKGIEEGREQGRQEGRQQGRQEGRQEGRQQGQRDLIMRLLDRQFGELNPELKRSIESLSSTQLEALSDAIFEFEAIEDLQRWLGQN